MNPNPTTHPKETAVKNLFARRPKKRQPLDLSKPVDWDAAKAAAAAVNRGDLKEADRICARTANPEHTAFAAFRYID